MKNLANTIEATLKQLFNVAQNGNKENYNIDNAVGEVTIDGVEYQIQISLVADKKLWAKENEVRYSDFTTN